MPSITVHCHPAALYYFFCEKLYPLGNRRVKLDVLNVSVIPENDFSISCHIADILSRASGEDLNHCFTFSGDDEEHLAFIALASPNKTTPPRNH
jgi:hypothetical protein